MDTSAYLPSNAYAVVNISGEMGCENFRMHDSAQPAFRLPSGTVLPVLTYNDGQIIYIPVSGVLAVTRNGMWKVKTSDSSIEGV